MQKVFTILKKLFLNLLFTPLYNRARAVIKKVAHLISPNGEPFLKRLKELTIQFIKSLPGIIWSLLVENRGMILGIGIVGVVFIFLGYYVLYPSYMSPATKFYTSGLGYPAMMRKLNKPLPVVTSKTGERVFTRYVMGEGVCSSEPILVPVIPLATIKKVHFKEGEYVIKGQVLAELDSTLADIKLQSARLAISTANAELARVQSGSAYVLAQERPKMEKINLKTEKEKIALAAEKVGRLRKAHDKGVIARTFLIDAEEEYSRAQKSYEEALLRIEMAEKGVTKSLKIAQNAVQDAEEALQHRLYEINTYTIKAPVSGIIERVLVKEGEYNPDPGKPGFVIVSGLWFDTFFDQSDYPYVKTGQIGEIRLEAYPSITHPARVGRITPVVSFNEGGPEISRPLRPRGSGAPEWAATFRTKMQFTMVRDRYPIAMGMTGFGRLAIRKQSLAVPRSALLSVSAGAGILYLPGEDNTWVARKVEVGIVDDYAAEILSGIELGEDVIVEGHWILRETDQIEVTEEKEFDYTIGIKQFPLGNADRQRDPASLNQAVKMQQEEEQAEAQLLDDLLKEAEQSPSPAEIEDSPPQTEEEMKNAAESALLDDLLMEIESGGNQEKSIYIEDDNTMPPSLEELLEMEAQKELEQPDSTSDNDEE